MNIDGHDIIIIVVKSSSASQFDLLLLSQMFEDKPQYLFLFENSHKNVCAQHHKCLFSSQFIFMMISTLLFTSVVTHTHEGLLLCNYLALIFYSTWVHLIFWIESILIKWYLTIYTIAFYASFLYVAHAHARIFLKENIVGIFAKYPIFQ